MANYTMELNEVVSRLADGKTLGGGEERFPNDRTIFPINYNVTYINGLYREMNETANIFGRVVYPNSLNDRNFDYDQFYNNGNTTYRPERAISNTKNTKTLVSYIDHLEQKILLHYWFREIGVETIDKFIVMFRREFTENLQRINIKYKDALLCLNGLRHYFDWGMISRFNNDWVWGTWTAKTSNNNNVYFYDALPFEERLIVPSRLTNEYRDFGLKFTETKGVDDRANSNSKSSSKGESNTEGNSVQTSSNNISHKGKSKHSDTPYTQLNSLDNYNSNINEDESTDSDEGTSRNDNSNVNRSSSSSDVTTGATRTVSETKSGVNSDLNQNDFDKYLLEGTELISRIEDELIESLEGCFLQIF